MKLRRLEDKITLGLFVVLVTACGLVVWRVMNLAATLGG